MTTATRDQRAYPDMSDVTADETGDGSLQRPYTVHLPGFDGPLDLLLHLIEKNQLEITTISLVAVTDQFISYLRTWDEPPLPRLAEFVAMAARLLLIKSRSLLPRMSRQEETDDESDPLEDAERLRLHLLEYKTAREIARALRARELAGLQTFSRPERLVDPEAVLAWSPPQLVGLNVDALAMVFRRVIAEKRLAEPEKIPLPLVTIAQKIAEVEALLRERGRATLEEVLRGADSRFAVVVIFLAVLELWHQSRLIVQQEALFAPIEILPGPKFGQRIEATTVSGETPATEPVGEEAEETEELTPAPTSRRARRKG
ncbi:MAG TPA: segregation/condensation protein A [Ktedonobacterales bacterium]|nr:segregation/condensation protein A [Ktedonobacterales bacterium]